MRVYICRMWPSDGRGWLRGRRGSELGDSWVTALSRAVWSSPHGELAAGAQASQRPSHGPQLGFGQNVLVTGQVRRRRRFGD